MAAAIDLCSLDDVRARLKRQATQTNDDELIEGLITATSGLVMQYCQREFAPAGEAGVTRVFTTSGHTLDLAPYDVRAVTAVVRDAGEDNEHEYESTEYKLRPKPAVFGAYQWIEIPNPGHEIEVSVTGTWGFATVPVQVSHACAMEVSRLVRADIDAYSTVYVPDIDAIQRGEMLSSGVRGMLSQFRRAGVRR